VLSGQMPTPITQGRMTYDLRRLRLHGMIERIPKTHRYQVTPFGMRAALFFTRVHARLYRPAVTQFSTKAPPENSRLALPFQKLDDTIGRYIQEANLAP
jgi:predicted MarR family transcription regulator